jgi:hypothetical protein
MRSRIEKIHNFDLKRGIRGTFLVPPKTRVGVLRRRSDGCKSEKPVPKLEIDEISDRF